MWAVWPALSGGGTPVELLAQLGRVRLLIPVVGRTEIGLLIDSP